jgi:GT2 family glycosyltransferase
MASVDINIVRYNQEFQMLRDCVHAALGQIFDNFTVTVTENGSRDSIKEQLLLEFGDHSRFRYEENPTNLGFAGAHNRFFAQSDADFVMPLNPDAVITPTYIAELVRVFENAKLGAATGKMIKFETLPDGSHVLDGTGIVLSRARRGRERGQLETDHKQFDTQRQVFGVSGTAPLYRKVALESVRLYQQEYFDEDFFAYWEDLDLSWRLRLAGYECAYVPEAVVYHSRVAGQSRYGYKRPWEYVKHHKQFPSRIRAWNWRNQLFAIVKNDFGWSFWRDSPFILARQGSMLCYIVLFEPELLSTIPKFLCMFPRMMKKRRLIQKKRTIGSSAISKWFSHS